MELMWTAELLRSCPEITLDRVFTTILTDDPESELISSEVDYSCGVSF